MSASSVAIVGPTASGKTSLAIDVARHLDAEIISIDSRQIYRGMDIGTAKPTAAQRAMVPHHGLDLVDPGMRFSAGAFARFARGCVQEIASRGKVPLLVGGTGFFLRALTHPIFSQPPLEAGRREALGAWLERHDDATLRGWLGHLDAESSARPQGAGGRQRLLRALELPLLTGYPLSWWHRNTEPEAEPVRPLVFVLEPPRERLDRAIDERVDAMVDEGLFNEVEGLLRRGFTEKDPGMNAVGYVELIPALRGDRSIEDALALIRKHTRAYARRQLTWFRHQLPPGSVWLDASLPRDVLVGDILARTAESVAFASKE